jgi:ethanolamine utilization microcompartment shell protein EutS
LLRQPGVISVNSNVVGTVYIAEVSVKVSKVSDIENTGRYLWVSAPITKVGVNEISVDINAIINGNYRVYVANDKGVLSAASLNMVVVSMARIYDRVAAQSWSRQFGTRIFDDVWSIAVDAAGNVYTAGSTGGDLYGFNAGVEFDIFVNKFDLLGNLIASVQFGTAFDDSQPYISVDTSGNVFIAGWTQGAFAGNTRLGGGDGFVAKFNSSLVLQGTVKQFGTTINERVYSLAVDGLGNVYVGGQTSGAFTGNTNLGEYDGFVAKFNSSLVLQGTVKQFGTTGIDGVGALAADGSGSVYVAGNTAGAFSGYTNLGSRDAFVAKFNSSLDLQGTVKQFGTAGEDQVWGVVVDGSGSVYVAGPTDGAFTGFTNLGDYDGFAAKFNSSLDLQGTVKQFGTTGADLTYSIAVDDASNVYIAGSTAGAFSGNTNLGIEDGFVAKFNSSLVLQGTVKQFGTSELDEAYSVAVDSARFVFVAGCSGGDVFGNNAGESDAFIYKEVA